MSRLLGVSTHRCWLKLRVPTGERVVIFVVLVGVKGVVGILLKLSVLRSGGFLQRKPNCLVDMK